MRRAALALLLLLPLPAPAQDWSDLDALILPALTASGVAEASYWLPSSPDPASAGEALAVVYEPIPGAAGNTTVAAGLFVRRGAGFALARRVEGLFGLSPRDAAFLPERIEVTTTMLNPGDPRCCPTGTARWAIDRASGVATRLE